MQVIGKIRLEKNSADIAALIARGLGAHSLSVVRSARPKLILAVQQRLKEALLSSPEYISLAKGRLRADFGLPDDQFADSIVDQWVDKVTTFGPINKYTSNARFVTKFGIGLVDDSFSDVLAHLRARVDTEAGESLPWLEWLLFRGISTIIYNYRVLYGRGYPQSRSGLAIMAASKTKRFAVAAEFAGTKRNNWATRAIDSIGDKIDNDVINIISNEWGN